MKYRLVFVFVALILSTAAFAKETVKLLGGQKLVGTVSRVCKTGILFTPDGEGGPRFIAWSLILFVQYKDGSKVRPEDVPPPPKVKEEPKETTLKHEAKDALKTANRFFKKGADYFEGKIKGANGGAASPALTDTIVTAKTNSDTLTIIPIPLPVLAGKDDNEVIAFAKDCEDMEFDKGFHDAEAHYLGKKARNSVMITTFFFAPAGLVTWAAMHPFKPRPKAGYASDMKLVNNHDYIDGYKLKAAATKKVRMRHGFWWGLGATFVTTTTLYFATGANHGDGSGTGGGGGVHWHHH